MKRLVDILVKHSIWVKSVVIAVCILSFSFIFNAELLVLIPITLLIILTFMFFRVAGISFTPADRKYYTMPAAMLDRALERNEHGMLDRKYSREGYSEDGNDCDDSTDAWKVTLHEDEEIARYRKIQGKADPFFPFSFRRSDNGRRHRVLMVLTDKGRKYIENYRINGSMYRNLDIKEENNGHVPS
jgi:hypothetical protein